MGQCIQIRSFLHQRQSAANNAFVQSSAQISPRPWHTITIVTLYEIPTERRFHREKLPRKGPKVKLAEVPVVVKNDPLSDWLNPGMEQNEGEESSEQLEGTHPALMEDIPS